LFHWPLTKFKPALIGDESLDTFQETVEPCQKRRRKSLPPLRTDGALPPRKVSKAELREMLCHNGKWYSDQGELERALHREKDEAELQPWAIPDCMAEPKRERCGASQSGASCNGRYRYVEESSKEKSRIRRAG
jgi:hypothetical protein